ncbi:regulatory LuxR family protein [Stackebrandtia endophytica]|uniref:Regulatory LuxR family protein n=1 Tax=Stackebrandtia endophytica TaxID=1496996 RepID=A0A543ARZ4_9ACTN|nr:regulatory LuxR family protein [Stackebrandtia endophytica]
MRLNGTTITGLSPHGGWQMEVWDRVSAGAMRIHREVRTHRRPGELRRATAAMMAALRNAGVDTTEVNVPTQQGPSTRRFELTGREQQVLTHISQGLSNIEIAAELFVSEDTVKTHARKLYRKLGARDRAHAVAIGFRRGVLS